MKIARTLETIPVPSGGSLSVMSRPRGGDWLHDELEHLLEHGVHGVVNLLTHHEQRELDLLEEQKLCFDLGLDYWHYAIEDRQTPNNAQHFEAWLDTLLERFQTNYTMVIHCRQGIGRAGLVAAALLIRRGVSAENAITLVTKQRGVPVPETREQIEWLQRFAASPHRHRESA